MIHRVLEYEKILKILKKSGKRPGSIMETIVRLCSLIEMKSTVNAVREDPVDNLVLACAKDAGADFVISGDRHLLKLGSYESVKVMTATNFLERLEFANVE